MNLLISYLPVMPALLLGCFSLSVLAADDGQVYVDTTPFSDGYINHSAVLDTRMGVAISPQVIHERRSGASAQGILNVWDLSTGQVRERVRLPALAFELTVDRDRHLLAVIGGPGNRDDTEPFVLIYDYEKRRIAYESPRQLKPSRQEAAAFSNEPAGLVIAVNSENGSPAYARIDLENGGRVYPMAADQAMAILTASKEAQTRRLLESGLHGLDPLDADGGLVLTADGQDGVLWDVKSGRQVSRLGAGVRRLHGHTVSEDGLSLLGWTNTNDYPPRLHQLWIWDFSQMKFQLISTIPERLQGEVIYVEIQPGNREAMMVLAPRLPGIQEPAEALDKKHVLVEVDLTSGSMKESAVLPAYDQIYGWFKRGKVAFRQGQKLMQIEVKSGQQRMVTKSVRGDVLAVSPDGQRIWRTFRIETDNDDMSGMNQGIECISATTGRRLVSLPSRSQNFMQNARFDFREDDGATLVGSEVKTATGGFVHNELHLIDPDGSIRTMQISDPEGPMLFWCGFLKKDGLWRIGAARSNGILESFDAETGRPISQARRDENIEGWYQDLNRGCTMTLTGRAWLPREDGGLRLVQMMPSGEWQTLADLVLSGDERWLVRTASGHYWTHPGGQRKVSLQSGDHIRPISHLDLVFNRPDKVAQVMGANEIVVDDLEAVWQARLRRQGLTEAPLADAADLPAMQVEQTPFAAASPYWRPKLSWEGKEKVTSLHVLVNGVPLAGPQGTLVKDESSSTPEIHLSTGLNEVELFVRDARGVESLHWTRRIWLAASSSMPKPELHVLAVGVSKYLRSEWNLDYAAKDAGDFLDALRLKSGEFQQMHVTLLQDAQVTREAILVSAENLRNSNPDDHVIIYVAGHGMLGTDGRYFFGTHDIDFTHPTERGLSYDDIQKLLHGVPARRRLVFLDTCHAGDLDEAELARWKAETQAGADASVVMRGFSSSVTRPGSAVASLSRRRFLCRDLFADLRADTGAHVICAALGVQQAFESGDTRNGLFTHSLMQAMKSPEADLDLDGMVTVTELAKHSASMVQRLTGGLQQPISRESNEVLDFAFWPSQQTRQDPREFLANYFRWSSSAHSSHALLGHVLGLFASPCTYFGREADLATIRTDMEGYIEKFTTMNYDLKNVKITRRGDDSVSLSYDLHFQGVPIAGGTRKGVIPSQMQINHCGHTWQIHAIGKAGKAEIQETPPYVRRPSSTMPTNVNRGAQPISTPYDFLQAYLQMLATDRDGSASNLFVQNARYFGKEMSLSQIREDIREYAAKFDSQSYRIDPDSFRLVPQADGRMKLTYVLLFEAHNQTQRQLRRGKAPAEMILLWAQNRWLIESLRFTGKAMVETLVQ